MNFARTGFLALFAASAIPALAADADTVFDGMLDTSSIGAADFIRANPSADGRGVAIAILDSGVDMGVDGLAATAAGEPRVVVARDFTREAQVECRRTARDPSGGVSAGRGTLRALPESVTGDIWAGFLDEASFAASDVPDLNGNGRPGDRFGVVVFRDSDGRMKALLDLDGDGDMTDASVIGSYSDAYETTRFLGGTPADTYGPVTVAINIEQRGDDFVDVGFHMATGAHGTHVAGIAAGRGIAGQAGWNGIAPGATILSLKIGHNGLAGGATTSGSIRDAMMFAAEWGRAHGMPVVINLSYGIGSEIDGQSDIDAFCEGFAIDNPHVVVVTSAGNQGPGMSTIDTPAASSGVISVAALLTPASASELAGAPGIGAPVVMGFSSRGGEIAKPDVAAPGVAASTVPEWQHGDVMAGTSMASPQVAGAAALLLSALVQQHPGAIWNSGMVARALRAGARPVDGFTAIDYGAGLVNVPGAWRYLEKSLSAKGSATVQSIKVEMAVPTLGGRQGGAAYWRAGGWAPSEDDRVSVRVRPIFSGLAGARERSAWFDRFTLTADRPWVRLSKPAVHMKGETDANFEIWVDPEPAGGPGVHVAVVRGVSSSGTSFEFPVTFVKPWPATVDGCSSVVSLPGVRVAPGRIVRVPVAIPAGAGAVGIAARASAGERASAVVAVFDADGHALKRLGGPVDSAGGRSLDAVMDTSEMMSPGTLEAVISGDLSVTSRIDLDIRFNMIQASPIDWLRIEAGRPPVSTVDVVNNGSDAFAGSVEGRIDGFETSRQAVMRGDRYEEGFSTDPAIDKVEIEMEMTAADYARFTDVAVNVFDGSGAVVVRSGFVSRRLVVNVPAPADSGSAGFRLEVIGARAGGNGGEVRLQVRTRYFAKNGIALIGTMAGDRLVRLYPGIGARVDMRAASTPPAVPADACWFGRVDFIDRRDGAIRGVAAVRARPR